MKPLTIDELKSLEVGDWVWIKTKRGSGFYAQVDEDSDSEMLCALNETVPFAYRDYGTKGSPTKTKNRLTENLKLYAMKRKRDWRLGS